MDNVAYFSLVTQREYCAFIVLLFILNRILYDIVHHISSIKSLRSFLSVELRCPISFNFRHSRSIAIPTQASSKHVKCDMPAFILFLVGAQWRNDLWQDMLGLEILRLHGAISRLVLLIVRDT